MSGSGAIAQGAFLRYLPPVHWLEGDGARGSTSRLLKTFERMLWGLDAEATVIRAQAPTLSGIGNAITLASIDDAALFRPGDTVTLVGTVERETIATVDGAILVLAAALVAGPHGAGTVRIADLAPGDRHLRLDDTGALWPGAPVLLVQGDTGEAAFIDAVRGEAVTLRYGVANAYPMSDDAMRLRVIDGGAAIVGLDRGQLDYRAQIDRIPDLFDPWRAPLSPPNAPGVDYLEWFASWVALALEPGWSEYQRRHLIDRMVAIYRQRGLKRGLFTYLGIYAVAPSNPRVVIDDGVSVFSLAPSDDGRLSLAEVARASSIFASGQETSSLPHPTGLAADSAGSIFVCDTGDTADLFRPPALWRASATGEVPYDLAGPVPMPWPAPVHAGGPLDNPVAVAVDAADNVSVVDFGAPVGFGSQVSSIFRFAPPGYVLAVVIGPATVPAFSAIRPVDMVIDASGAFIVLDRGANLFGDPLEGPTGFARLVIVTEGPLAETLVALPGVVEPTAIAPDGAGRFLIADAADQNTTNPPDIWRIDPAGGWALTSLLSGLAAGTNPIVQPVGLAAESPTSILVLDSGLRRGVVGGDSANRTLAELAQVWRVDLSGPMPTIVPLLDERDLVNPVKLSRAPDGRLLVADRGEVLRGANPRNWRARHNEYGAVVHFSSLRPTTFDDRNAARRGVISVLDREGPDHAHVVVDF